MANHRSKSSLLDAAQEAQLIHAWRSHGDRVALERLVQAFTPLCRTWARRYSTQPDEVEDLIQEARIGLIKAVGKFEPERGFRLSTYARFWIQQYVEQAKEIGNAGVRIPTFSRRRLKQRSFDRTVFDRADSLRELADAGALDFVSVSLDTPADEAGSAPPIAALCAEPDPEATIIHALDIETRRASIMDALSGLDARRRRIIKARYLCDPSMTLQELGDELSLTRERVRQLEADALGRLRKTLQSVS